MIVMHEGSCLYVQRRDGTRLVILNDVDFNEACEYLLTELKHEYWLRDEKLTLAVSPAVRKVCYPRKPGKRQRSQTGWPRV